MDNLNILMKNLAVLDFEVKYGKEFSGLNKNSFVKANPNLMCTIIYFLLIKYDTNYNSDFSFCFPVITLKELKDFKEKSFDIIKNIINEELPVGKSALDSASGDRIVSLLRLLSDKVIVNEIKKIQNLGEGKIINFEQDYFPRGILSGQNISALNTQIQNLFKTEEFLEIKKNSILTNIELTKDKLIEDTKTYAKSHQEWKLFARELVDQLQVLEEDKLTKEKKLKNLKKFDTSIFSEIYALDRAPKLENHKLFLEMIKKITNQFSDNDNDNDKDNQNSEINKNEFLTNLDYINEQKQIYE